MNKNNLYIITAALPYVNNKIHLGHIYSTFLPANIHQKTLKLFGKRVLSISGSDVYGTRIIAESIRTNTPIYDLIDKYTKDHINSLKNLDINFSIFSNTTKDIHFNTVNKITKILLEKGIVFEDKEDFFYCNEHKIFLIDYLKTVDNTCSLCFDKKLKNNLSKKENIPVLKININKTITQKFLNSVHLSKTAAFEVKKVFTDKINNPFGSKIITRPIEFGVPIDFSLPGVYYVWYEAIMSYISFSENKWNKASEIIQYMGKDNIFFHVFFLSNIYLKHKTPNKIFGGNFLLENNVKFSKTEKIGIFCDDLKKNNINSDGVRFALSFLSREKDINMDIGLIKNIINNTLISKILNAFQRIFNFIYKFNMSINKELVNKEEVSCSINNLISFFNSIHEEQDFFSGMNIFIGMIDDINKTIETKEIWKTFKEEDIINIIFKLAVSSKILTIYCPKIGRKNIKYYV